MNTLISPRQTSFIPGRQGRDNIIIAQEACHTMRRTKRKCGFMAIKVDLEKAYDNIRWAFVVDTFSDLGFRDHFISVIYHCLSFVSFRVCVNGEKADSFTPQRGLRQGDPISPYIFVLCVERLSQLIDKRMVEGNWKSLVMAKGEIKLSHLFFPKDLLLFGEASKAQMEVVKICLDLFSSAADTKVSGAKTRVFFSKGVHHTRRA
uniref:Retrovirus-related Pol polyprotein LINE-1 n=1 Tax=Cajanus cajan TaxID=3821 RepID=A0A151SPG6_CAJCA|nr:Retrovirus-related Pol polyprotein LINE-1 [Cajanus cajan]